MKKLLIILSFLSLFCYFTLANQSVLAQAKILINEFLIDPQPQQVELINLGSETIDISNWIIDDSGGTIYYTIPQSNIIYPNSCLVFSGDFNLNKTTADTVRLINNQEIIDSFSYKSSAGVGISYMRLPDGENSWSSESANLGLFNSSKLSCIISPTPTITISPTQEIIPTNAIKPTLIESVTPLPTNSPVSYNNIYISEAMVNPETGNNEWIEIFNDNDFSVSLIDWYIDDLENSGSSIKSFSLEIPAHDYKVFNLTSSMFNNDGDTVRLLDFNKILKDNFEYSDSTEGKTYGRISTDNDNFCLQEPSFEQSNNPCINSTSQPTPTILTTKNPTPTKIVIATSKPSKKPTNYNIHIVSGLKNSLTPQQITDDQGEVLGIFVRSNKNQFLLVKTLSFISFSYSILVIVSVLIKNKVFNKYVLAS